jgi:biofilm PGA synthesis protein PgaA
VRGQTRAQQVRNSNELSVSLAGTRSSENLASGRGVILESKLLAKPMWGGHRPFIHEYFERGITNDLTSDYRRLGAGVQFNFPGGAQVEAEVQQEFFLHPKTSAGLTGSIQPDDHWTLRGKLDSNSLDVPLVARYYGISGWLAGIGARYRDSERWSVAADFSQLNMSDQNTRRAALLRGTANLVQGLSYKGGFELEYYRATNSINNAPYYNPPTSQTLMLSYVSDWTNYQRYSRSFGQHLVLSLGRQSESGFSSATIGGISYEQRVNLSDALSLSYGAGYVRRIYSGNVSSGPEIHLNLNWKFL